ncbi:MAG: GNAT family N-acetyltransferase [Alphaproteobacteria bacterium]|nr:GNAT family N-acetyltransferase [Alphaproteobacteria bacterium]
MLGRQIIGYVPSLVVPGIVSFATVYSFTRLLDPAQYGHYALAINVMTMLLGVGFFWLQSAASRLLPQAVAQGREASFTATLYALYLLSGAGLLILAVIIIIGFPLGDWRVATWFAPPLAVLRALLNLNQAYHRNFVRIARYNAIEIGQSVIGFAVALFLVIALHNGATGVVSGMMAGLAAMVLFDARQLASVRLRNADAAHLRDILHFGLPFVVNYGLSFIVARSDSFLIQIFDGAAAVGVYNAGYAFPDRIGQYLFMAVATASLPLTIRRMEQEGAAAARDQTYANGVAILALAVPACVGLLFANHLIGTLLIGADFRDGALRVMPWITVAMILNGLAAHYFDHAFHLAKRTRLFFYTLGPAAALNLVGNILLIPHYGYIAAAWTTLASYALYLVLSIIVGRRVFCIHFPFRPALHIVLAAALMALVLDFFPFSADLAGLAAMVAVGGASYGVGLLMFDVMGVRRRMMGRCRNVAVVDDAGLRFDILQRPDQITAIGGEWQTLHEQTERSPFGGYDQYRLWWETLGMSAGDRPHIVTARAASGELRGVLPLAVRRRGFVRVAEWAGYGVFDYGDAVAADAATDGLLWQFAQAGGRYDIALIKDVRSAALSAAFLPRAMSARKTKANYFLTLDFGSGDAWLSAQSRKLRGDARRKMEKMSMRGPVDFHHYRAGDVVPAAVIDTLYAQKKHWFDSRGAAGILAHAGVCDFLHNLAQDAARHNGLYLSWMTCGDAIVACHMGFVRDNILYLYHTTYDAAYAAFSPGNAMMIETIQYAINQGWRELDFMRGDESYKARFASGTRVLTDYIAGRGFVGRFAAALQKVVPSKKDAMSNGPE